MLHTVVLVLLLAVLEVSLSLDNAVVNASVLKRMDARWQAIFLTWGILIAVVGVRLILPTVVVALSSGLSIYDVAHMALFAPEEYAAHVPSAHNNIAAFGGAFLLLVFFGFSCDKDKNLHWLEWPEKALSKFGAIDSAEIAITIMILIGAGIPLLPGLLGIITFIIMKGIAGGLSGTSVVMSGVVGFLYLEILDASFSLDGVMGAFALTDNIVLVMIGLGIGAAVIRGLTVHLVRQGTLDELQFLEHGAHWGIGALAGLMLASISIHIPEVITGLIGVSFIGASYLSSVKKRKVS